MQEEYTSEQEDALQTIQFTLNSSDYLKAASPLVSQSPILHEVTVEVSEIEIRSQDNQIPVQKR